jgi:ClpX C4-type zinc finger
MLSHDDQAGYQDVTCSFCGRHNREVRVVAHADLVVCQICVAACAEIFDDEVGIDGPPGGWTTRWPLKS